MKRTPLMFAALAPLLATAGEGSALQSTIDIQKLQNDIRASQVIGADVNVQDAQGEDVGRVDDLLIAGDGRVAAVLIDGLTRMDGRQVGTVTDEGLKVAWDDVRYDPAAETVSLASAASALQRSRLSSMNSHASGMQTGSEARAAATDADTRGTPASGSSAGESFPAGELIGMDVHLSDAKSFGEVEDVLIDEQDGKASALVVGAWEGFDRQTYALPVELQGVNREDHAIDYPYTESDVVALQEYERE